MENPTMAVLGGVAATAVFVFALVQFILYGVRRVHAAAFAKLEPEGIVRRSGLVRTHLKLRGYSGKEVTHSSATSIRKAELVLTKKGLVLLMPFTIRVGAPPWNALTVEVLEGKLHLVTEQPPEATGQVEITAHLPDADGWLASLRS
ncbi:MAG: hypothetical protein Q8L48_39245 [Archangium sp.]|nr:hypothetical protein [Archangium sp.]